MMPLPENFMDMVPTRNPGSATMLKLRYHVKAGCFSSQLSRPVGSFRARAEQSTEAIPVFSARAAQ